MRYWNFKYLHSQTNMPHFNIISLSIFIYIVIRVFFNLNKSITVHKILSVIITNIHILIIFHNISSMSFSWMSSFIVTSKLKILVATFPLRKIIILKCGKTVSKEIERRKFDLLYVCLTSSLKRLAASVNFLSLY